MEDGLKWQFVLDKHSTDRKKTQNLGKKALRLTRSLRRDLNLLKLPKNGWSYASLNKLRETWKCYMRENLDLLGNISALETNWNNFGVALGKCELIGANITVIRAKNTEIVDMCGTVVLETKETFQIVTKKSDRLKSKLIL